MKRERNIDGVTVDLSFIQVNGVGLNVASAGTGTPVLLLHGWPFNWYLWHRVLPGLVRNGFRVIAPDLRGIGESDRPKDGYDLFTLCEDWVQLLDALHVDQANVVGFDIGLQSALMLALRHPSRVKHLVLTESLAGRLAGAERFLKAGPPWWFGFHSAAGLAGAPGLAEEVIAGREEQYLNWFYQNSTVQKLSAESRAEYVRAYAGVEGLRGGFAHYRAFATDAEQIKATLDVSRLTHPTLVIGGGIVGDATYHQLQPFADDLHYKLIEDCGHVTPQEQPEAFLQHLLGFFASS